MSHWAADDASFTIREYGQVEASAALIEAVPASAWDELRLSATLSATHGKWTVGASQYVGVARLRVGTREVPLQVTPKLPVDIFFMADYAFGSDERNAIVERRLRADLDVVRTDPAAALLAWFIADIESFARRHLRRLYQLRREVLEGGPRERFLLDDYVAGHLAFGLPQEVPCEFPDLTFDTLPNRAIRATLRYALAQSSLLRLAEARRVLARRARRALALFAGVSDVRVTSGLFADVARSSPPRHYRKVLDLCEAFASGLYMEREIGGHARQAFLWDMNSLFQEALRGLLDAWPAGRLDTATKARAAVHDAAGQRLRRSKVDPDYILKPYAGGLLLLDAKYKDTKLQQDDEQEVSVSGVGTIKISRSDVYQAVAYREHEGFPGATVGLVFPVALRAGNALPEPYTVRGFGAPVHLIFVDVGVAAQTNLDSFYAQLDKLAVVPAVAAA